MWFKATNENPTFYASDLSNVIVYQSIADREGGGVWYLNSYRRKPVTVGNQLMGVAHTYPGDSVSAEPANSRACEHHVVVQAVCKGVSWEGEVVWNAVLLWRCVWEGGEGERDICNCDVPLFFCLFLHSYPFWVGGEVEWWGHHRIVVHYYDYCSHPPLLPPPHTHTHRPSTHKLRSGAPP